MAVKKETVNWFYDGKEIKSLADTAKGSIGFVYKITNITKGLTYIGRKTMLKPNKTKLVKPPEYPWKTYCGSSKALLEDLKNGDEYSKEILVWCYSKAELTYHETSFILCSGALLDEKSYNFWIKATVYKKHLMKK